MAQSTLQISETLDKGTMIALRRDSHTKLHHWGMVLLIAQPDFSPELEGEKGVGVGGLGGGGEGPPPYIFLLYRVPAFPPTGKMPENDADH